MYNIEKLPNHKEAGIIKTLVFFDMFDYPLTAFEIWCYLPQECGIMDVLDLLGNSRNLKDKIGNKNGYYFLKGRENIINIRLERYHYSDRKFKIAKKFIYLFRLLPWIRMVAMANMIGANNLRHESDIDLFIITASKRIWITRFFCAGLVKFFNARPRPGKKKDKICLSFYISQDRLAVDNLMLADDIYFKHWLVSLFPILSGDGVYGDFIKANGYIRAEFPNWRPFEAVEDRKISCFKNKLYFEIFELFFGGLDRAAGRLQLRILPRSLKQLLNKDTRVVMNSQILKMFASDRREIYKRRYKAKLMELLPPLSSL